MSAGDGLVQALLGCQWGRGVQTPDDPDPCEARAVQVVVVHDGDDALPLKLCAHHRDRVLAETTARASA